MERKLEYVSENRMKRNFVNNPEDLLKEICEGNFLKET